MAGTEVTLRTLEYHCTADGTCHCDWRIVLVDCVESMAMKGINIGNIAVSGLAAVIGIMLLIHRIAIKGHRFFDVSSGRGCLRPKPIDCMLLMLLIFNILRLLSSALLVSNVAHNTISRMFMFEFPWQFGYGGFALYLLGIAQTLADSHQAISSDWLPSPRAVDVIGCTFFFGPFITNNIAALAGGALAHSNVYAAEICVRLLYVFWFIHCTTLSAAVLFAGVRLVWILNRHLEKFQSSGPRYISVKTGIFKIRAVMGIIVVCLLLFAIFLLIYGMLRNHIMVNSVGSIFLGAIWNYLGAVTTLCVEIAVMFNPNLGSTFAGGLKAGSSGAGGKGNYSTTVFSAFHHGNSGSGHGYGVRGSRLGMTFTHEDTSDIDISTSAAVGAMGTGFSGTMNHQTYDDLKQQQIQYQQVFHKHNQRHHGNGGAGSSSSGCGGGGGGGGSSSIPGSQMGCGSSSKRNDDTIHMDDLSFYSATYTPEDKHYKQRNPEHFVWLAHMDDHILNNDFRDNLSSHYKLMQPAERY